MTFYIAGKITGDPDYKSKFDAMKGRILEAWPWCQVLNPADNPPGMRNADYMRLSFAMIDCADVVIFLPDWEESKGARIEKAYCEYIGKTWMASTDYLNVQTAVSTTIDAIDAFVNFINNGMDRST